MCTYCTDDMRNFRLMSLSLSKSGSGLPYLKKLKLRASSPNVLNLKSGMPDKKRRMQNEKCGMCKAGYGMGNAECRMRDAE